MPPYEEIINNTWRFECCTEDDKPIRGVISRSINYIARKHCPHFKFHPHKVNTVRDANHLMMESKNKFDLNKKGVHGDHFIFAPISMDAYLYYAMQYNPGLVTLHTFSESEGMITVQRRSDVDLPHRILRAIKTSSVVIIFLALALPTIAVALWVMDRQNLKPNCNPIRVVFNKMYLSVVTLTTVGYGDVVPKTWIGKVRLVLSHRGRRCISFSLKTKTYYLHFYFKLKTSLNSILLYSRHTQLP